MSDLRQETKRLLQDGDAMIHCQSYTDICNHIRSLQARVNELEKDAGRLNMIATDCLIVIEELKAYTTGPRVSQLKKNILGGTYQ